MMPLFSTFPPFRPNYTPFPLYTLDKKDNPQKIPQITTRDFHNGKAAIGLVVIVFCLGGCVAAMTLPCARQLLNDTETGRGVQVCTLRTTR